MILGNKVGMMQIFDDTGIALPATVIKVGPCFITQIKKKEECGYNAVQIGYGASSKKNLTKPERRHLRSKKLPLLRHLQEYRVENLTNFQKTIQSVNPGELRLKIKLDVSLLQNVKSVDVTGYTIGKGHAGNIKRHNFNRGAMTHGSKHHRLQGSLGAGTSPGRVFPGKRMSGHLGMEKRTIKNLQILEINQENNLLVLKGCIPGKKGNLVNITF
jgi:large subunit ribosomal protein L3